MQTHEKYKQIFHMRMGSDRLPTRPMTLRWLPKESKMCFNTKITTRYSLPEATCVSRQAADKGKTKSGRKCTAILPAKKCGEWVRTRRGWTGRAGMAAPRWLARPRMGTPSSTRLHAPCETHKCLFTPSETCDPLGSFYFSLTQTNK